MVGSAQNLIFLRLEMVGDAVSRSRKNVTIGVCVMEKKVICLFFITEFFCFKNHALFFGFVHC